MLSRGSSTAASAASGPALIQTNFEIAVLKALREEGLEVRRIWRIFPPLEAADTHEALWVDMDGRAATTYHGPGGELLLGPLLGFGP